MRFRLLCLVLPLLYSACGCQTTNPQPASVKPVRIIIGFDETVNSPDPELIANLGNELGCELQPLQALGGNAYAYNCATAYTEELLMQKLGGLSTHMGVRYAEIDRIRRIQK